MWYDNARQLATVSIFSCSAYGLMIARICHRQLTMHMVGTGRALEDTASAAHVHIAGIGTEAHHVVAPVPVASDWPSGRTGARAPRCSAAIRWRARAPNMSTSNVCQTLQQQLCVQARDGCAPPFHHLERHADLLLVTPTINHARLVSCQRITVLALELVQSSQHQYDVRNIAAPRAPNVIPKKVGRSVDAVRHLHC